MLSFWEKTSFLNYDYIVIGGGIVGLSTAAAIKEKNKDVSVLVLERGIFPTGASTKNAGFACFGSLTELLNDIAQLGKNGCYELVQERWSGLRKLRERIGDRNMDYQGEGGYELITEDQEHCLDSIEEVNGLLRPLFKNEVFINSPYLIGQFGFAPEKIKTVVYNPFEGQIDSGKMMKALTGYVTSLGVEIITGAEVVNIAEFQSDVSVMVKAPLHEEKIEFRAEMIAVCTNAFSDQLLTDLDLAPGRGLVLATQPIENLRIKGSFHFDEGFYYFRNFNDRIIFGGGRNMALADETTSEFEVNEMILQQLEKLLSELIIPGREYEIDTVWAGIMAFGEEKRPILKMHSNRIAVGVRLGGMGVAIGSQLGEKLADMIV
ncbi:MAG: FAD-dependent oxidoreductase [Bacteroidota bacterium]